MSFKKFSASLLALALTAPPSWGVGHVVPGAYPNHHKDGIHHPSAKLISHFGSLRAAIIGSSSGPKTVAVILVQFPASTHISGSASFTSGLGSGAVDAYFTQMSNYFKEVSYNKIPSITFKFFGVNTVSPTGDALASTAGAYTMPAGKPEEYYGCGDEGADCASLGITTPTTPFSNANGNYLIADALTKAVNATGGIGVGGPRSTNATSPGPFDAVIVMHAGNGNETTQGFVGDIWSIFYSQDDVIKGANPSNPTAASAGFDEGDVVPETEASGITSPLGVMCHEFGHELGLPDLYNTGSVGGTSVVGAWELMDYGPFDGAGANPSHMGAWDKQFLNWSTPQTSSGSIVVPVVETNPTGTVRLNVPNGGSQEYFLVEYRSKTSGAAFDRNIPNSGLLIWHIDDAITSARGIAATDPSLVNTVNTGNPHYGVSIITADGSNIGLSRGGPGDPFGNGSIFITPRSDNFAGQPSGISIVNISGVGSPTVSATVAALAVSPSQSILRAINYPNPAGKGYPHPNGEGHTTIQFQLSRPAQDYSINLYTLSADLVKKIGKDDITLNITRSSDNKWVYEYTWDLENGNGAHVAPGTYLCLVRADGETKTTKIVVIR